MTNKLDTDCFIGHPNVVALRIENFDERVQDLSSGYAWKSDTYILKIQGRYSKFNLKLAPGRDLNSVNECSLYIYTINCFWLYPFCGLRKTTVWLEKIDGTQIKFKGALEGFTRKSASCKKFMIPEDFDVFRDSSVVFICVQFLSNVEMVGTLSNLVTSHRWTISDYKTRLQTAPAGDLLKSDPLVINGLEDVKFVVEIKPKKRSAELRLTIGELPGRQPISLLIDWWTENLDGDQGRNQVDYYTYKNDNECGQFRSYFFEQFVDCESLTICCKVRQVLKTTDLVTLTPSFALLRGVAKSFNDETVSDLEVHGGSSVFKVNTLVLLSQSPALGKMIETALDKNKKKFIKIDGVDDSVLEAMLRFLYTHEVDNLKELAADLLPVAVKFELKLLIELCTTEILKNLSVDHALRDLKLAFGLHEMIDFEERVLEFAHVNCKIIRKMPEWPEFCLNNPLILRALLERAYL